MDGYKHIERAIGEYIAARYRKVAEVGCGRNADTALVIAAAGADIVCTDIKPAPEGFPVPFAHDDIFSPDLSLYRGRDLIYSIRPAVEMVPALIDCAEKAGCDLLVYHLGFETYGDGGEVIDCGVLIHRYVRAQKPSKSVA
jgi:hypothetical protein